MGKGVYVLAGNFPVLIGQIQGDAEQNWFLKALFSH